MAERQAASPPRTSRPAAETPSSLALQLAETLDRLAELHERWLELMLQQREALRLADHAAVATLTASQERTATATIGLHKKALASRLRLAERLGWSAQATAEAEAATPRISQLADELDEPAAQRLRQAAERLKRAAEDNQGQVRSLHQAIAGMAGHLQDIVRLIAEAMGAAGVYSRPGPDQPRRLGLSTFSATA